MNEVLETEIVMKFVQDFFINYDKNRHILHTLFATDGTYIVLGNRSCGHTAIQQKMLTMATTTHQLCSIDVQNLQIPLSEKMSMFQVLCAGSVEFGSDTQICGFTASIIVCFKWPSTLNVLSFNERCQCPKL